MTDPAEIVEVREELDLAVRLVGRLPDPLRRALVLRADEGFTLERIGRILRISREGARSRLVVARARLGRMVAAAGHGLPPKVTRYEPRFVDTKSRRHTDMATSRFTSPPEILMAVAPPVGSGHAPSAEDGPGQGPSVPRRGSAEPESPVGRCPPDPPVGSGGVRKRTSTDAAHEVTRGR